MNITCDGSVAKPEHAQCSHFRSMAEVSFLQSANTRKRASASREHNLYSKLATHHSKRHISFVAQEQILGDLKTYLAIEMSQNNTLTHGKLWRCQTKRSNMHITAEIMQTYEICRNTI